MLYFRSSDREGKPMHDYYDLGTYSRPVTTHSPQAQLWFDRGLLWCYGYNHDESIRCFHKVIERDPNCAMAYWGIAYASGPNYNKRGDAFIEQELKEAVAQARVATHTALAHIDGAKPVGQALIRALEQQKPNSDSSSMPGGECRTHATSSTTHAPTFWPLR
ncbi:hypothetical protein [Pseudomonas sp. ANT_H12B]|uniref:hypothetical protein n=1 Tax=Pseudomonas sp. ANT_H12B TaxID=2597348 RepID=UPI00211711B9|nr:hypothetical protein [Pseudomonas sp. ANT_H12B]